MATLPLTCPIYKIAASFTLPGDYFIQAVPERLAQIVTGSTENPPAIFKEDGQTWFLDPAQQFMYFKIEDRHNLLHLVSDRADDNQDRYNKLTDAVKPLIDTIDKFETELYPF